MSTLEELIDENSDLELRDNGKIHVISTKHDCPYNLEMLQSYISSYKYKKSRECNNHDFDQYIPFILQHKNDKNKMYSVLTGHILNKIPKEIQSEMNGRRYKRLKRLYDDDVAIKIEKDKKYKEKMLARKRSMASKGKDNNDDNNNNNDNDNNNNNNSDNNCCIEYDSNT
eukprot:GHVR01119343.1.p1 GENE.GHVR01119343.1~~GHVR01119343.1.p1  ORF type:complete len:170 (-),score=58.98 GHVR01119343.1:716-1225(-)